MTIRVNGRVIPPEAVEYELGRLVRFYAEHLSESQIAKQMTTLRERAKQQAIGAKLLIDEAARLDLPVPEPDVQTKLSEVIEGCGGSEAFRKMLEKQKVTEATVRAGIVQGRRVDLLVERIASGLSDPTEAELRAHFEAHAEEYARQPRAAARHILVKFDGESNEERATAHAKLEKIRRDIVGGADFADQAAMYSDCPSGRETGGSLGWFSQGMTVPEFDRVAFSLRVDELSDIVESPLGFHLIHKTGQEEGGPSTYEDVREKVREFLRHARRGEAIAAYVDDLRAKAAIEED